MRILIVTGGETGEREVSLRSAATVKSWLTKFAEIEILLWPEERELLGNRATNSDLVIPIIHGKGGEDGQVQSLLDRLQVKYLFSKPAIHKICLDKVATKQCVSDFVRVPKSFTAQDYYLPMVVKDPVGGSSLDTYLIRKRQDLDGLDLSAQLIEEYVQGREFTVAVVESVNGLVALPVIEIVAKGFFDFQQKYDKNNLAKEICPAAISEPLERDLRTLAVKIHSHLGVRHLSRVDFLVTSRGDIVFLEINTIPGLTETSLVPKAMTAAGIDPTELFHYWINQI